MGRSPEGKLGFIGIGLKITTAGKLPQPARRAVLTTVTIPGVPGYACLRLGDLILALDGEILARPDNPVAAEQTFQQMIGSQRAGQIVTLMVRRGRSDIELAFPLANWLPLQVVYDPKTMPDVARRQAALAGNTATIDIRPDHAPSIDDQNEPYSKRPSTLSVFATARHALCRPHVEDSLALA